MMEFFTIIALPISPTPHKHYSASLRERPGWRRRRRLTEHRRFAPETPRKAKPKKPGFQSARCPISPEDNHRESVAEHIRRYDRLGNARNRERERRTKLRENETSQTRKKLQTKKLGKKKKKTPFPMAGRRTFFFEGLSRPLLRTDGEATKLRFAEHAERPDGAGPVRRGAETSHRLGTLEQL